MQNLIKVEFTLSGDLADLYLQILEKKGREGTLEHLNQGIAAAGIIQYISALAARGYFSNEEIQELTLAIKRVLEKTATSLIDDESAQLVRPQLGPTVTAFKTRRHILVKSLERMKRILDKESLPPEILLQEILLLKDKLDRLAYTLGNQES